MRPTDKSSRLDKNRGFDVITNADETEFDSGGEEFGVNYGSNFNGGPGGDVGRYCGGKHQDSPGECNSDRDNSDAEYGEYSGKCSDSD